MDKLLNPKQLAEILNVRVGTIYSWLSRGVEIPPSIKIGGSTRWREKSILQWLEGKEKKRKKRNFED
jgi:predicted DNA-binding transcriptional regulator AlpA